MSNPIPEPYKWDDSFAVFYSLLDDEHKGLFDAVFECANNKGDAGKLANLVSLTDKHFSDEEKMLVANKYSDYDNHKKAHTEFLTKIKGLKAPLDDGTITYAKAWLVNHIKGTDFKYKGKLG